MGIDEQIFHALNQAGSNPGLDLLMVALTTIGLTYILVLAGPILWWQGHRELGFDVVVLVVITDIIVTVLKSVFMRERPFEVLTGVHMLSWGSFTTAGGDAMPSGHAAGAFAMATLVALGIRGRVAAFVLVLATLIALSRVYLGLHWPSDILAGALLGVALALIMRWVGNRDNLYTRARKRAIAWLRGPGRLDQTSA